VDARDYALLTRSHERFLRQVELDLAFFIEDVGSLNLHSITSRIKSFEGATAKSRKLGLPVEEMRDIAGLRVVVSTRPEVEIIRRFFTRQQDSKDLQIEMDEAVQKDDGYRSWHLVAGFHGHYQRSVHGGRIEVQIPTVFEHAFNLISRAWVYKSKTSFAAGWEGRFKQLSNQLAGIDRLAATLHDEVVQSASRAVGTAPLSPMSYIRIVRDAFGEDTTLEDAVDSCRMLVDVGLMTNGDLVAWFGDPEIQSLWDEFHLLADRGNSSAESVVRSRRDFWMFHGLRLEWGKRLLEELKAEKSHEEPKMP
jgi:ppGpp synthetase/RelA/SpoT-type nucleotidyltranferase